MRWNNKLFKKINDQLKSCKIQFVFITQKTGRVVKYDVSKNFLITLWKIYDKYENDIMRLEIHKCNSNGQPTKKLYSYTTKKRPQLLFTHSNNFNVLLWKTFDAKERKVYNKILMSQIKEFCLDNNSPH